MRKRDFDKLVIGATDALFTPEAETGAAAPETVTPQDETEPAKRKVARHWLLDKDGKEVEDEESAYGIGYQVIGAAKPFTHMYGQNADADRMAAIFGYKTLATNESSAARGGKEPADADGQMEAVRERFALVGTGKWVDRTREGVGARIDLDALAGAIVDVASRATPPQQKDFANVRQKLEEDVGLRRIMRNQPEIAAEYIKRAGRPGKSLDEALAAI